MASMTLEGHWMLRSDIQTSDDFQLYPIQTDVLDAVAESMQTHGYDVAEPITLWNGVVVDGNTRYKAATQAKLDQVYVVDKPFESWEDAFDYAMKRQRDRRTLSTQERHGYDARCVQRLDKRKAYGDRRSQDFKASADALKGKSAAETASKVGVSQPTVERIRYVLRSGSESIITKLLAGEITPVAAVEMVKELRSVYSVEQWAELSTEECSEIVTVGRTCNKTLNEQNTTSIEWAQWSWNPVTGCLHNCPYCYARDIANRFYVEKFVPTFRPDRLSAPFRQKVPAQAETELGYRNIFTCSMADLFGKWVPSEWIQAVIDVARDCPQWNFLFLTKFPVRLSQFEFPDNAWLGTTVDCQARVKFAEKSFSKVKGGVKWLSVEPLLEPLHFESLEMFDWVVIGGASASNETPIWIPPRRWVLDLECQARDAGCMIYEKTNMGLSGESRLREYPGWERAEATLPSALAYLPSIG